MIKGEAYEKTNNKHAACRCHDFHINSYDGNGKDEREKIW